MEWLSFMGVLLRTLLQLWHLLLNFFKKEKFLNGEKNLGEAFEWTKKCQATWE
jgi:hypothetical protein